MAIGSIAKLWLTSTTTITTTTTPAAERLLAIREDIADWLNTIMGLSISEDTLMHTLANGVLVCELAEVRSWRCFLLFWCAWGLFATGHAHPLLLLSSSSCSSSSSSSFSSSSSSSFFFFFVDD